MSNPVHTHRASGMSGTKHTARSTQGGVKSNPHCETVQRSGVASLCALTAGMECIRRGAQSQTANTSVDHNTTRLGESSSNPLDLHSAPRNWHSCGQQVSSGSDNVSRLPHRNFKVACIKFDLWINSTRNKCTSLCTRVVMNRSNNLAENRVNKNNNKYIIRWSIQGTHKHGIRQKNNFMYTYVL